MYNSNSIRNNRERRNNLLLPLHRVIRRNRSTHGGGGWAPLPDHVAGLATPPTDQTRERAGLGTMTEFVTNGALGRPARIPHAAFEQNQAPLNQSRHLSITRVILSE